MHILYIYQVCILGSWQIDIVRASGCTMKVVEGLRGGNNTDSSSKTRKEEGQKNEEKTATGREFR